MPEHPLASNAAVTHTVGTITFHSLGPFPGARLLTQITYQIATLNPNVLVIGAILDQTGRTDASTFRAGRALLTKSSRTAEGQPVHEGNALDMSGQRFIIPLFIPFLAGSNYVLFRVASGGVASTNLLVIMTATVTELNFPAPPAAAEPAP